MSRLFLVKHALPEIEPDVPAKMWQLGERGGAQSARLAEALRPYRPSVVISSAEPKAAETGRIIAETLDSPYSTAPDLHENDREGLPYFTDFSDLEAAIREFFDNPESRVIGRESAYEARQRFMTALGRALRPHPDQDVVIVAHGTVNTLFVTAHNPLEPLALWQSWQLGTFALLSCPGLSRPDYTLLEPPRPLE